jgi:hypothetical protein
MSTSGRPRKNLSRIRKQKSTVVCHGMLFQNTCTVFRASGASIALFASRLAGCTLQAHMHLTYVQRATEWTRQQDFQAKANRERILLRFLDVVNLGNSALWWRCVFPRQGGGNASRVERKRASLDDQGDMQLSHIKSNTTEVLLQINNDGKPIVSKRLCPRTWGGVNNEKGQESQQK